MTAALPEFVAVLGWALVDFLWQGLAIGAAAALALLALRNARPQARYAVACAALALCVALPVAQVWLGSTEGAAAVAPIKAFSFYGDAASIKAFSFYGDAAGVASMQPLHSTWHAVVQAQLPWIVITWSLGAGLLALRMALGCAWVNRASAHAGAVDAHWQRRLDRLAHALGLASPIRLRLATELDTPVAAGWWRPVILVPAALLAHLPADLLEALLAHELAHIKRHDYLVNLLQSAVEALLFYHPVVWWLSRRIRLEREQIADDLALQAIGEPRRLALALQALDRFQALQARTPPLQFAPAAHGGNLMARIQRLLRPNRHSLNWRMALPILGLTAVCLSVYAQGAPRAPVAAAAPTASVAPVAAVAPAPAASAAVPAVAPVAATPRVASFTATPGVAPVASTPGVAPVAATPRVAPVAATPRIRPVATAATPFAVHRDHEDPYAMVRDGQDGMMLSGDMDDVTAVNQLRQHVHGDFLWFRRSGKAYVVQDPSVLASARAAWRPSEELGGKMEGLSAQMRPHSEKMDALGKQMDALSKRGEPISAQMEQTSRRMEPLAKQQQALSGKMQQLGEQMQRADTDAQREQLSGKMEALQGQMEQLQAQMEQGYKVMSQQGEALQKAHAPMQALGAQMEAASKPMQALGQQMQVLGEQQQKLSLEADGKVKVLIDQALRSGKAVPAQSIVSP